MKTKNFLLLSSLLFLTSCESRESKTPLNLSKNNTAIIGGSPARNEDPVAASTVSLIIEFDDAPFSVCTGTLISTNLVLTATHCLDSMEQGDISVYLGAQLPTTLDKARLLKASGWVTHPDYELILDADEYPVTGLNDIALLRLAENAPASARPVPILGKKANLPAGQSLLLAGYGLLKEIGEPVYSKELNYVKVPLVRVWDNLLITDQTKGEGACSGDSGGPAYLETSKGLIVVGVTRGPHDKAVDCRHYGEYTYASKFESFILKAAKDLAGEAPQFVDLPRNF